MSRENPKTIAIVGASADRSKFGNKAVRAYQSAGWRVMPVNPRGGEIEGLAVARSLDELADAPERVSLYLPPERTRSLLPAIARSAGAATELWLNPGSATPEIAAEAEALGLTVRSACSIVDIGRSPSEFS